MPARQRQAQPKPAKPKPTTAKQRQTRRAAPKERTITVPQSREDVAALLCEPMTLGSATLPASALVLTVEEVAKLLRIGRTAAYRLILSGELPSLKIGQYRRIPLVSLQEYISAGTGAA